ncbi:MAG: Ig-like domain-containing protein [Bacteroidetes bacterium]|nr:Ig-like domain-containing protein [Bacteroidota bacterium]
MKSVQVFLGYIGISIFCLGWLSCANIVSPTGGERDTQAPVMVKTNIPDSSINFKGGKIVFEFDEFIQVKDIMNQMMITPLVKTQPKVSVHKRKLSIDIEDSLLENNTTYHLSMGDAVSDIREGNIYKNLQFTFSTGAYFDSLSLYGKVLDANTGKPDTSSLVLLYAANKSDSAWLNEKPLYMQKTDGGNFNFKNLPNKEFKMYALSDANKNLYYDLASERIAFYHTAVVAGDSNEIRLYSFIEQAKQDTTTSKKVFIQKTAATSTKTATTKLSYSLNVDTTNKTKRTFDINDSIRFVFDKPLALMDETKIRLYQEKTLDASAIVEFDSSKKVITLSTQWVEEASYTLTVLKGFAQDSLGLQAPAMAYTFTTKRKSDYGTLLLRCNKNENDVVLLMKNDKIIAQQKMSDTLIRFNGLIPDNYFISILHDENKNGKWDAGNYKIKQQPEKVDYYPQPITIKANWENKLDLVMAFDKKPKLKSK